MEDIVDSSSLGVTTSYIESFSLLNDISPFATQTAQFLNFILQMSCLPLSSHLLLRLPCNLVVIGKLQITCTKHEDVMGTGQS